jgi:hypothetical protein
VTQRADAGQTELVRELIVDAAGAVVESRVRAVDGNARLHEVEQHASLGGRGRELLDGLEEDRVMADDELGGGFNRLGDGFGRDREAGHHALGGRGGVAQQEADVVPFRRQGQRRNRLQCCDEIRIGSHEPSPC